MLGLVAVGWAGLGWVQGVGCWRIPKGVEEREGGESRYTGMSG